MLTSFPKILISDLGKVIISYMKRHLKNLKNPIKYLKDCQVLKKKLRNTNIKSSKIWPEIAMFLSRYPPITFYRQQLRKKPQVSHNIEKCFFFFKENDSST